MDKSFEEKISNKLYNNPAGVPKGQWDKINEKLDQPFESSLEAKFKGFERNANPAIWASIASSLPGSIEAGIQAKMEGVEVPAGNAAWEGISERLEQVPGSFEYALQDKFSGFTAPAPAGTLEAIEAKMDAEKVGGHWPKVLVPALMLIFIAGLFTFIPTGLNNTDSEKAPANIVAANNSDPEHSLNQNSTSQPYFTANEEVANHVKLSNGIDHKTATSHSESGSEQEGGSNAHTNNLYASGNNHGTQSNGPDIPNRDKVIVNRADIDQDHFVTNSSLTQDHGVASLASLDLKNLEPEKPNFPFKAKTFFGESIENSIVADEPTRKSTISVLASSGYFNIRNSSDAPASLYGDGYADFHEALYTGGNFLGIGSNVKIGISAHRSINTGIQLTSAKQYMEFSTYEKEIPDYTSLRTEDGVVTNSYNPQSNLLNEKKERNLSALSVVDQEEIRGDSIVKGNNYQLSNSFVFVDIPLGMTFEVLDKRKHSLNITGGCKMRIVAGANTFHLTPGRDQIVEVSPALSQSFYQSSLAGFASIDYSRAIDDNLEVFIGPEIAVNFSDINREGTWMSMRPFQVGLSVGLRQHLN